MLYGLKLSLHRILAIYSSQTYTHGHTTHTRIHTLLSLLHTHIHTRSLFVKKMLAEQNMSIPIYTLSASVSGVNPIKHLF